MSAACLALVSVAEFAPLTMAERLVGDLRLGTLLAPEPQESDIVIVAVTEPTLRLFPYRSPVDREFLANLLTGLESERPRAIGVYLLFDQPTEPAKDAALKDVIAKATVPIVIGYTTDPRIVDEQQLAYLNDYFPPADRVAMYLASDQFGVVRWNASGFRDRNGSAVPGFARGLLAKIGVETPDGLPELAWHGRPDSQTSPFRIYPAEIVKGMPADWIKGKIVLVGEIVSLTDRYPTPFSTVNGGTLSGVEILAHSVSQLLHHRRPAGVGNGANFLISLVVAGIATWIVMTCTRMVARIGLGTLLVVLIWVFGFVLFRYSQIEIALVMPTIALCAAMWAGESVMRGKTMDKL